MRFHTFLASICMLGVVSGVAAAADKVNSKESLRLCKSAAEEQAAEGAVYKFKRNAVTSVDSDRFTHLVNLVETQGSEKNVMKLRCEISRVGDVISLDMEPGRWKM